MSVYDRTYVSLWVKLAVIQAYRFALDPTLEQDAVLRSHCGGQRYAFNWGWRW